MVSLTSLRMIRLTRLSGTWLLKHDNRLTTRGRSLRFTPFQEWLLMRFCMPLPSTAAWTTYPLFSSPSNASKTTSRCSSRRSRSSPHSTCTKSRAMSQIKHHQSKRMVLHHWVGSTRHHRETWIVKFQTIQLLTTLPLDIRKQMKSLKKIAFLKWTVTHLKTWTK